MSESKELKGLGGWLILVGIGVIFGPLRMAYEYVPLYYSIFTEGTFEILTTPGTENYNALWGPLLIFETLYNTTILFASVYLIYLFFTKHYLFPKFYIAIVLASLVFIPLDAWLVSHILTDEPIFDPDTTKEFSRTVMSALIWIPYMLVSKRVKATFIEQMPENTNSQDTSTTGVTG